MGNLGNDIVSSPILVTGSKGYLGSCIVKKLEKEKIEVVSTSRSSDSNNVKACNLTNKNEVKQLLERVNPSKIIHCAAAVPKDVNGIAVGYESIDVAEKSFAMASNIAATSTCPIVFISSMSVYDYGALLENPVCEKEVVHRPNTPYAVSKYNAEKLTESGLIVLRLPGLFGKPRITGVLYKAAYAFLLGEEFKLKSTPLWAAMHIDDAASSCIKAVKISNFPRFDTINIGYSNIFNIIDVIKLLANMCDVEWDEGALIAPSFQANIEKSKKYMLHSENSFKDRLKQLVLDVRNDIINS